MGRVYGELEKYWRVAAKRLIVPALVAAFYVVARSSMQIVIHDGFACTSSSIVACKVDGNVVIANFGEHQDLFRMNKDGSNSFGILTPFVPENQPN